MATFESILIHLGPTAEPLMVFLHNKEATQLLAASKYVADFVSGHATRWGFAPPPYSQHADGGFTLRSTTETRRFPPLRDWEDLTFTRSSRHVGPPSYYVGLRGNLTTIPIFRGSQEMIMAIRDAAHPYLVARRHHRRIERAADEVAQARAWPSPPAINPWSKGRISATGD